MTKSPDLYAYFLVRSLQLVSEDGVVSVISSDKWLETGYGISLQEKLKDHLIAVYGQRDRSFGADINTVITVYAAGKQNLPIHFTYLQSYSRNEIRQDVAVEKARLKPGKWFYLRDGSRFFLEKILPKLSHRLSDFAELKRGFTTGANDFFCMKDASHLYEGDYLANPKDFEQWGVKAKTRKELVRQGLIYIENEAEERFVIERKDVAPLIRSPKELRSYSIPDPVTLCLYTESPGKLTASYIAHGEKMGIPNRPTLKGRKPWFKPPDLKPARVLLQKSLMDKLYVPICNKPVLCQDRLYTVDCKDPDKVWLYLTSTIFLITVELYCRRLGGGASDIMVEDYQDMPVPPLSELKINHNPERLLSRETLRYYEETKQQDRKELDKAVLTSMGFDKPDELLPELHQSFIDAVEDRLIKANRPLRTTMEEARSEGEPDQ